MIPLSLRVPDELAMRLDKEAGREGKMRSEILRDAIDHYLSFLDRERFLSDMAEAARALAADTEAKIESKALGESGVEDGLDGLIAAEGEDARPSHRPWWT